MAFYLGAHAHSDHIGNADEIIRRYRPKLIFSPEYSDQWTTDANLMGWGAKISTFGRSAFLAADLMDTDSDWTTHNGFEERISSEVGGVDILKAGHHGQESSNFEKLLGALAPSTIIQTGLAEDAPDRLRRDAIHGDGCGSRWATPGARAARPGLRHPSRLRPPEGPIPRGPVKSERTDRRNWRDHACAGVHWNH